MSADGFGTKMLGKPDIRVYSLHKMPFALMSLIEQKISYFCIDIYIANKVYLEVVYNVTYHANLRYDKGVLKQCEL